MGPEAISLNDFLELPLEDVARLVRAVGPQVCVFPINGTRRWFLLEHSAEIKGDPFKAYVEASSRNHINLYKMIFDHGIDTLLTPTLGPDILLRGETYMQKIGAEGLALLARGPEFLEFYEEHDVRVHFYGDHRKNLSATPHAYLSDLFENAERETSSHQRCRLFFGVFANDATERIAELSVEYYKKHGTSPNKKWLVEQYYGEYVEPADLFIGFDRLSVFDYPLLALGEEDLYFTVAPSPYLTSKQLRTILFDHLFTRRMEEPDYSTLTPAERQRMREFYRANVNNTIGLGDIVAGNWVPRLEITEPKDMD